MTNPNWSLLGGGNNALNFFQMGSQIGQQVRERQVEKERRNALADIYKGQSQPVPGGGIGGGIIEQRERDAAAPDPYARLAAIDPEAAMRLRQQQAQQVQKSREQKRADLPLLSRLIETSVDEPSYQRNRAVAQEYGIDTSNLPPQFDPAWREQQLNTLKALQDPSKVEALSTAGKQAVDMGYKPGTAEFNKVVQDIWTAGEAKPYVVGGETRLYSPKLGGQGQAVGSPPPAAVAELKANPGSAAQFDEIFGPGASARFLQQSGGPAPQASGTFRGSFSGLPGETVTSTYRDPAHNKRVGGVSNSYHTRRTADGKPMARDSVPPPGMSMAAYAAELRRRNPGMDVINEGDHVHIEPKG